MTEQEIRQTYLDAIKPKIESATQYAGDPLFDKLWEFCTSLEGYRLFHPFLEDFNHSTFPTFCDLWSWLTYCWDDDGSTSFVCADVEHDLKKGSMKEVFVMRGDPHNLPLAIVTKLSLKHFPSGARMINYVATHFLQSDVTFLHGLLPEFERVRKLAECVGYTAQLNSNSYFKAQEAHHAFEEHDKIYALIERRIREADLE